MTNATAHHNSDVGQVWFCTRLDLNLLRCSHKVTLFKVVSTSSLQGYYTGILVKITLFRCHCAPVTLCKQISRWVFCLMPIRYFCRMLSTTDLVTLLVVVIANNEASQGMERIVPCDILSVFSNCCTDNRYIQLLGSIQEDRNKVE